MTSSGTSDMQVLDDAAISDLVTPAVAAEAMREAALAAWRGELVAPPRATVPLDAARLAFTCGARSGHWFGYRSYRAPGSGTEDQVVVLQDEASGRVRAIAVGSALGPRRVAGIGAVALDAMGPTAPERIALIGTGGQAWHQLWGLPARFRGLPVTVHSRTPERREDFAVRARRELDLDIRAAESAQAAVDGADVVILATSSSTPVLAAQNIRSGAHVTTLGPKQVGRSEFEPSLAADAALVVTDSPDQVAAYDPPNVLVGSGVDERLTHLGAVLAGEVPVPDGTRMFFSVGLAGTEAWLLDAAVRSA